MVLDIPERLLIGEPRDGRRPPLMRKCTSKIPSVRDSFQRLMDEQVAKYNLHTRMTALFEKISCDMTFEKKADQDEYECIEERIQRAVKYADEKCRKARVGTVASSPQQNRLMGTIFLFHQIKRRFLFKGKPNRPRMRRIQRLANKYKYKGQLVYTSIAQINQELTRHIQEYNEFKKYAKEERWAHLESIARELDQISGKGIQHHFKILQYNERRKDFFRTIRKSEGKTNGGSVDKVMVEDDEGGRIVHEKTAIERAIMNANMGKLLQANDTPLRDDRIATLLGEQGDFERWEEILSGMLTLPHNVDEGLETWYHYITNVEKHEPATFMWTTKEYCESWRKIDENKTTIPGIQVAHIKSLVAESPTADVVSKLALIPLLVGYSPKRWRIGIDSMIPKK
jgi:hypothetical protein